MLALTRDHDLWTREPVQSMACSWYLSFLQSRIRESWVPLFLPILVDINEASYSPVETDFAAAMRVLTVIVTELQQQNSALVEIVNALYIQNLLKEIDIDRSHASQLVFAAIGWISKY